MADTLAPEFIALQQALVGRYSLEHELGRGGMGIVFLARDVALDRMVAIKLLPPAAAAQPALRERFLREAQTAAKLSHPNIIPIYQVEQRGDLVWFVMMYVEGDTLGQRLRTKGPLTPANGVKLLQEVAWALAYAHLRGIVHRDVKPDNILIDTHTGRALVSDFGIARATEISGATAIGEILGTAQYMSPEQACGEKVDGRSDIYSLGCVGFLALSGKLPFDAPDMPALLAQHITKPAPPLASMAPGVPGRVAQAIDKCLAKSPDDRWPTGETFAEALAESTAVAREVPAPIRVWLAKGEGVRPVLYGWTALISVSAIAEFIAMLFGRNQGPGIDSLFAIAVPWTVFVLYRLYQTQRLIAAGYTHEDLTMAFRQHVELRREELAFEYDREPPLWAKILRKVAFMGLGVAAAGAVYAWLSPVPSVQITAWLLGGGAALAAGGGILGRLFPGKRLAARDSTLDYRVKLQESKLGRLLYKFAGVGVTPAALPAGSAHRPTELAIGMAADQIFAALPKDQRKELKDLPDLVKRLEAEAQAERARVDEMNAMIAGIREATPTSGSSTLRGSDAGSALNDRQAQLRTDLEAKRDKASTRLAVCVAALENIRLDLLRLKAGVGTVDQLTADLSAARELHAEVDRALAAQREVEALAPPAD
jgi:eukaryotic-like serine/threonine-protein kinase